MAHKDTPSSWPFRKRFVVAIVEVDDMMVFIQLLRLRPLLILVVLVKPSCVMLDHIEIHYSCHYDRIWMFCVCDAAFTIFLREAAICDGESVMKMGLEPLPQRKVVPEYVSEIKIQAECCDSMSTALAL